MSNEMAILAAGPDLAIAQPSPAVYITEVMGRARQRLAYEAVRGNLDQIAALRNQAETIRAWAAAASLGDAAELAAAEIVRRAERALALGIRAGQAAGTIRRPRSHNGNQYTGTYAKDGLVVPTDYASQGELMGGGGDGYGGSKPGFYHLADNVSSEQFEEAIAACIADRTLTRMALWRRLRPHPDDGGWVPGPLERGPEAAIRRRDLIREMAGEGWSSRQMSQRLGTLDGTIRKIAREAVPPISIPADKSVARTLRHNDDRLVEETTHILEGAAMSLGLASPSELDPAQVKDWAASLSASTRAINRFVRKMKETPQ